MKLVKESITKKYKEDCYIDEIKQYEYDDMKEKEKHKTEMENEGFSDSGQVRENIGTTANPEYVYFGSYYKFYREKIK